jgi:hypothetical protein
MSMGLGPLCCGGFSFRGVKGSIVFRPGRTCCVPPDRSAVHGNSHSISARIAFCRSGSRKGGLGARTRWKKDGRPVRTVPQEPQRTLSVGAYSPWFSSSEGLHERHRMAASRRNLMRMAPSTFISLERSSTVNRNNSLTLLLCSAEIIITIMLFQYFWTMAAHFHGCSRPPVD